MTTAASLGALNPQPTTLGTVGIQGYARDGGGGDGENGVGALDPQMTTDGTTKSRADAAKLHAMAGCGERGVDGRW